MNKISKENPMYWQDTVILLLIGIVIAILQFEDIDNSPVVKVIAICAILFIGYVVGVLRTEARLK